MDYSKGKLLKCNNSGMIYVITSRRYSNYFGHDMIQLEPIDLHIESLKLSLSEYDLNELFKPHLDLNHAFEIYKSAKINIDKTIHEMYPKDKVLVWARGPYKGRECVVVQPTFDETDTRKFHLQIRVKTRTKDGKRFIESNDMFHRCFHSRSEFVLPGEKLPKEKSKEPIKITDDMV